MDPDLALKKGREAVAAIFEALDADRDPEPADARAVAEAFDALDGWLSRGGFVPTDWRGTDY